MSRKLAFASAAIGLIVASFIVIVALRAGPYAVQEIIRERSPIAWLSTMLLVASATLALVIGLTRAPAFHALASALFLAALDERFMGHENLKWLILRRFFDSDKQAMGHWGDAPMVFVPLAGGALLWILRKELQGRTCRWLLASAFSVGVVAIALDIATIHPLGQLVEELVEVAAETLVLVALLTLVDENKSRR